MKARNTLKEDSNSEPVLRPLWDAILEIYEVFVTICEKHGLRYCADCGTTLGAVRHGGFIPWDDDLDIEMPRPDYDKFVALAKTELPEGYAWLDRFNCPQYEHAFGKIIITDKEKVADVARKSKMLLGQGIFIDIFPMDGYPDSSLGRLWRKAQNRLLELIPMVGKVMRDLKLVKDASGQRIKIHRFLADVYERRARRYPFGATQMCVSIGVSRAFDDKPYAFRWFGCPKSVRFDNTTMRIQEDAAGYLSMVFGDYMKMPPIECRHPSHATGGMFSPWRFGLGEGVSTTRTMRKVFITFADGGDNFIMARKRIVKQARETAQFDEVFEYGWRDITIQEVLNSPLREYARGNGYWLWKPAVIYMTLCRMKDGDALVYCDAGNVLFKSCRQWEAFFRLLEKHDLVCRRISASHIQYARKELLEKFGGVGGIKGRLAFQYEMSSVFLKKTPFVMRLIKDWLDFMLTNPDLVRDVESEKEAAAQLPTFVENRHDQAVFSLLAEKCFSNNELRTKIKTVWEFHVGWLLYGYPCIEVARLRSDGTFRFNGRQMIVRILYRLLWRLQLMLERQGVCIFWEKRGYYGA